MIRWSCHRLHGCVPVAPSPICCSRASAWICERRSCILAAASWKASQRPVRISTSDAISSPTTCSANSVRSAAAFSGSKRLVSSSVSRSRSANSSSTASVRSAPESNSSRLRASSSCHVPFCSSPIGGSLAAWLKQAARDAGPRPALDDGAPRSLPEELTIFTRQREQLVQLRAKIGGVAALERRKVAERRRVLLFEARGNLGEPRVSRDERRGACRSGFGGDHAEGFGEDRRHDRHVGERQQLREVAVLERPREERSCRRHRL